MTRSPGTRPRLRRLGALAAELAVVFLGVWGAFLLDGCREQRAADHRRQQIVQALRQDIAEGAEDFRAARTWFGKTFEQPFLDPYEAGEQPPLRPIPIAFAASAESWSAMLAAGGVEVLDVEQIHAVESLVALTRYQATVASEYNAYVRTVLVPDLGGTVEASRFYDPATGRLRSSYLWYYYSLRALRDAFDATGERLAAVDEALEPGGREEE